MRKLFLLLLLVFLSSTATAFVNFTEQLADQNFEPRTEEPVTTAPLQLGVMLAAGLKDSTPAPEQSADVALNGKFAEQLEDNEQLISVEELSDLFTSSLADNGTGVVFVDHNNVRRRAVVKHKAELSKDKYNFTVEIDTGKKLVFKEINSPNTLELKFEHVHRRGFVNTVAIDLTGLNYTNATYTAKAQGTELYKCKEWVYSEQRCDGSWVKIQDLVPGETYSVDLFPEDPALSEGGGIFFDGFEAGLTSNWTVNGSGTVWSASTTDPFNGTQHAEVIQPGNNNPTSMRINISTVGYENINVRYARRLLGIDSADEFAVQWFDGTTWSTIEATGDASANGNYVVQNFSLGGNANNNPNFALHFHCEANAGNEGCRVDDVFVNGTVLSGNVTSCQTVVTESTFVANNLQTSITDPTDACLEIGANNIVLDCQGFTLTGNRSGRGIEVINRVNVTVQNCFVQNFTDGMFVNNVNNSLLFNNTLLNNSDDGLDLQDINHSVINQNNISRNFDNNVVFIRGVSNNFTNNIVAHSAGDVSAQGLALFTDTRFTLVANNTFINNQDEGIRVTGNNNTLLDNIIETSGDDGIEIADSIGQIVRFNTVTMSADDGIVLSGGNYSLIENNTLSNNSNDGIFVTSGSNRNTFRANVILDHIANFSDGISILSNLDDQEDNLVEGNIIINIGDDGIQFINRSFRAVVRNNTVIRTGLVTVLGDGILFVGVMTGNISGNNLTDLGNRGMRISRSANITIERNHIRNVSDRFINIFRTNNTQLINNTLLEDGPTEFILEDTENSVLEDTEIGNYTFTNASLTVKKNGKGTLAFKGKATGKGRNLSQVIKIEQDDVFVNVSAAPEFNQSANITFEAINGTTPEIILGADYDLDGTFVNCIGTICAIDNNNQSLAQVRINVTEMTHFRIALGRVKVNDISSASGGNVFLNETADLRINATAAITRTIDNATVNLTFPNGTTVELRLLNETTDIYNFTLNDVLLRGQYNLTFAADDNTGVANTTTIAEFNRAAFDVIDAVNRTNAKLNFTTTVEANSSGLLNLTIAINGTKVKNARIRGHSSNSVFSRLRIEEMTPEEGEFSSQFAVDTEFLNATEITITQNATGTSVYNCTNWNFDAQTCRGNSWKKIKSTTPGQNYNITIRPGSAGFREANLPVELLDRNNLLVARNITTLQSGGDLANISVKGKNSHFKEAIVRNYNTSSGKEIRIAAEPKGLSFNDRFVTHVFAVDPQDAVFDNITLKFIASGNELYKCKNYNYTLSSCTDNNWTKVLDTIPGQQYTLTLSANDPGFGQTSPSTGTADAGNITGLFNAIGGTFTNTQLNDESYFSVEGIQTGPGSGRDLVVNMSLAYNISIISSNPGNTITQLNISFQYCTGQNLGSTCGTFNPPQGTPGPHNVFIQNNTANVFQFVGAYNSTNPNFEQNRSFILSGANLSAFVDSQGFVRTRYSSEFQDGRSAFHVDFSQLTVTFVSALGNVSVVKIDVFDPVTVSSNLTYRINVTSNGNRNVSNVTLNDTYPPQAIFLTAQPTPLAGTNNTFILGNFTPNQSIQVNVTLFTTNVSDGTIINNTANVTFRDNNAVLQSRVATQSTTINSPPGTLTLRLLSPPENITTQVGQNRTFLIQANLSCTGVTTGCSNITSFAQRNFSTGGAAGFPADWFNTNFTFRRNVTFVEPASQRRNNSHVLFNVTLGTNRLANENGTILVCNGTQVRFDAYALSTSGGFVTQLEGLAEINISANQTKTCQLYYSPTFNGTEIQPIFRGWNFACNNAYDNCGTPAALQPSNVTAIGNQSNITGTTNCAGDADSFTTNYWCYFKSPVGGTQTFAVASDDGGSLSINGTLVADSRACQAVTCQSGSFPGLVQNRYYRMFVDYDESGGGNQLEAIWNFTTCSGSSFAGNYIDTECFPYFGGPWQINGTVGQEQSGGGTEFINISTVVGATPFFTISSQPQNCLLGIGQSCLLNWTVNASGALNSINRVRVNGSSNLSTVISKFTNNATIQIVVPNDPPVTENVTLNASSSNNLTTDNLTVTFDSFDINGNTIRNITDWRVNNRSIALLNMPFETNVTNISIGAVRDYSTLRTNGTRGNGTAAQAPLWNLSGRVGGAYVFDGVNDWISTTSTAVQNSSNFTITAWFRTRTIPVNNVSGTTQMLLWQGQSGANGFGNGAAQTEQEMHLTLGRIRNGTPAFIGSQLHFFLGNTDEAFSGNMLNVTAPFNNTQNFTFVAIAVSNMSSSPVAQLYVNGILQGTDNVATLSGTSRTNWTSPLRIGRTGTATRFFNGTMDEVLIFNRSLSAEQINQMFSSGNRSRHVTTMLSQETRNGQVWQTCVTPNDNKLDGNTTCSNNLSIGVVVQNTTLLVNHTANTVDVAEEFNLTANYTFTSDGTTVLDATCIANVSNNIRRFHTGVGALTSANSLDSDINISNNTILRVDIRTNSLGFFLPNESSFDAVTRMHRHGVPADNLRIYLRCDDNFSIDNNFLIDNITSGEVLVEPGISVITSVFNRSDVIVPGNTNCSLLYESSGSNITDHWSVLFADTNNVFAQNSTFVSTNFGQNYTNRTNISHADVGHSLTTLGRRTLSFNNSGSNQYELIRLHGDGPGNFTNIVNCSANNAVTRVANDTIEVVDNVAPVVNISSITPNPAQFDVDNVTVIWSASDFALDQKILNVTFPNGTTLLTTTDSPLILNVSNLVLEGNYTLIAFANDTSGLSATNNATLVVNRAPNITIIHPLGQTFADNKFIPLTVNVTDVDGVSNISANVTLPNGSVRVVVDFGGDTPSDNFDTNTTNVVWATQGVFEASQTCIRDIDNISPNRAFTSLSGTPSVNTLTTCGFSSIRTVEGDFNVTIDWDTNRTLREIDTAVVLSMSERPRFSFANKQVILTNLNRTGANMRYQLFRNQNGSTDIFANIPTNDTLSSRMRIERVGQNFTFFRHNGTNFTFLNTTFANLSRVLFIQFGSVTIAPGFGAINISWDNLTVQSVNDTFAIFNETQVNGTYNVQFIANDTNNFFSKNTTNFTIEIVNDPPSTPAVLVPAPLQFISSKVNITWVQVEDEEDDVLQYNITLLNSTGGFNATIALNLTDGNRTTFEWNTTDHDDGTYNVRVTVYENETAERRATSDTVNINFVIDNSGPFIVVGDCVPQPTNPFQLVFCNATVTDSGAGLSQVSVNLTLPNGSVIQPTVNSQGSDVYNFSVNGTLNGDYTALWIANDTVTFTRNNINTTNDTFAVGTPPTVIINAPLNETFDEESIVVISANITDSDGLDVTLAEVTLPNGTKVNLTLENGLESDNFDTDTEGTIWQERVATLPGQSCTFDIDTTVPDKMHTRINGTAGIGSSACGFNSIKRMDGDFDINISWDIERNAVGSFMDFRVRESSNISLTTKVAIIRLTNSSFFGREYQLLTSDNATSEIRTRVNTTDVSGKFRINRTGNNFTFYYFNNSNSNWVTLNETIFLNLSRALHTQVVLASNFPTFGQINVSWDNFSKTGANFTFGLFNQTSANGTYSYRILANDTFGALNNTENNTFNIVFINDPPTQPLVLTPLPNQFINQQFNISWIQVTDEENDVLQYNITLLNSTGGFNATIALNLTDGTTTSFLFNTTDHADGTYNLRVTVYENETAERNENSDTVNSNFFIDNTPPIVVNITPVAGTNISQNDLVNVSADVVDAFAGVSVVVAEVTLPNGTKRNFTLNNITSATYQVEFNETATLGQYDVRFFANDTLPNLNETETTFFVSLDAIVPDVFDVRPVTGAQTDIVDSFSVSTIVTDNANVSIVSANVTRPDGSLLQLSLTNNEYAPDINTILLLHLNEETGTTTLTDSSAIKANATVEGGNVTVNVTGKFGKAIEFNGSDGRINVTASALYNFGASEDFTLEAWVNASSIFTTGNLTIIGKIGATGAGYELLVNDNTGFANFFINNGTQEFVANGSTDMFTNGLIHVAGVRDTATSECRLYVDGILEATTTCPAHDLTNDEPLLIGNNLATADPFFGVIDDVRISNVTRTGFAPNYYNTTISNLTLRGQYNISFTANDTQNNLNATVTTIFTRKAFDLVDLRLRTGDVLESSTFVFANYTVTTLSNVSGVLNLSISMNDSRVRVVNITAHDANSVDSIIDIDDWQQRTGSSTLFAVEPGDLNFTNITLTVNASGQVLRKCENWNFVDRRCNAEFTTVQNIVPGQLYTINLNATDPGFSESSPAVDVALAPVSNETFVLVFVRNDTNTLEFRYLNTNGSVISNRTIDATVDTDSRVSVAPINSTHVAVSWVDGPSDIIRRQIFNVTGTNTTQALNVVTSVGLFTDVSVAQMGNRFAVCNANDGNRDAEFRAYNNSNASQVVSTVQVDNDMRPEATLQNLVECAGVNTTRTVFAWFDDQGPNTVVYSILDQNGNIIVDRQIIDNTPGDAAQVATTAIDSNKFAVLWYDVQEEDVTFTVRHIDNTEILAPTDIDTLVGTDSRVAITAVRNTSASGDFFVTVWYNQSQNAIKAAVFNGTGSIITQPFTVDSTPNSAFRLLDVTAKEPITNNSICPGKFVVAFSNSTSQGIFKGFDINGSAWDGVCAVQQPDLRLNATSIFFNNTFPRENENISVNVTICNVGTAAATSFNVTFKDGNETGGVEISNETISSLAPGACVVANDTYVSVIGNRTICAVADAPLPTGVITESNESNNVGCTQLHVQQYSFFFGQIDANLTLGDNDADLHYAWNHTDGGNLYYYDADSAFNFSALQALGRNTTNGTAENDFEEATISLNMTVFNESITLLWAVDNSTPRRLANMTIAGRLIEGVPIINSTNTSFFITGILWDTQDDIGGDGQFDITDSEDLVFVVNISQDRTGGLGDSIDYEARIPSLLREYKASADVISVITELK